MRHVFSVYGRAILQQIGHHLCMTALISCMQCIPDLCSYLHQLFCDVAVADAGDKLEWTFQQLLTSMFGRCGPIYTPLDYSSKYFPSIPVCRSVDDVA